MKKIIYSTMALLALLTGTGCRKYVEIDQVGKRTLKYTTDFQYLLNDYYIFEPLAYWPLLASDEVAITDSTMMLYLTDNQRNTFTWAEYIFGDQNDGDWDNLYKQIYYCNTIIDQVMSSKGGTDTQKLSIQAEAKVDRAYAYFMLVNIYARQYDASTANTDPGVPLLLHPDFFTDLTRASVTTVYNQVIQDLQDALPYLYDLPALNIHASKAAVFAGLARVYLQQGLYDKAAGYADSTLKLQSGLNDMNSFIASSLNIPKRMNDPEYIYAKSMTPYSLQIEISQSALQLFDTTDLRYKIYTHPGPDFGYKFARGYWFPRINGESTPVGPTVPEMMLIKAEALARGGEATPAVNILNTIRQKRFRPADYVAFTAASAGEALNLVLTERRRELLCRLSRWFDQRRLNKEAAFAETVTRQLNGQTYTLLPNSNRYVFPIAQKYIAQNPEIEQNPR